MRTPAPAAGCWIARRSAGPHGAQRLVAGRAHIPAQFIQPVTNTIDLSLDIRRGIGPQVSRAEFEFTQASGVNADQLADVGDLVIVHL